MSTVWRYGAADPEVSLCIPTYDRSQQRVQAATDAIYLYTQEVDYEIVIVDCERELRGYTEPMNEAMAAAKGEILVALNDDVRVTPGWLEPLTRELYSGAWCATPDMTHTDGPQIFAPYCMAWMRCHWHEIGGLDNQFVWWCSDIDLARRLVDMGHSPVRVKLPSPILHELNATATEHPELGEICSRDLERFQTKWGVGAEAEKHRLAALCPA